MEPQPFQIKARIGDGAHSEVFLATLSPTEHRAFLQEFPNVKKEVAVKVLMKTSLPQAETEAVLMRELAHPNVCELYGIYTYEGRYCLAMEYHIEDLFSFAFPPEGREPLSEGAALHIFSQVLLGVHHLHSKGFLHGDIKLENVLMSGMRACLTDFGKAHAFGTEKKVFPVGTLPYTAPETLQKTPVIGPETDVWSLGVLLYALIEGYFPFYGDTRKLMRASMAHPLRFSTASIAAQVLITSMLTRRPQLRPSTAELLTSPLLVPIVHKVLAEQACDAVGTPIVTVEAAPARGRVGEHRSSDEQALHELQQILFGTDGESQDGRLPRPVSDSLTLKAQGECCGISPPPTPCTQQDTSLVH